MTSTAAIRTISMYRSAQTQPPQYLPETHIYENPKPRTNEMSQSYAAEKDGVLHKMDKAVHSTSRLPTRQRYSPTKAESPMSQSYSAGVTVFPTTHEGVSSPEDIPRVRNIPVVQENSRQHDGQEPSARISRDEPLYQIHASKGERTISAGGLIPKRMPNSSFVAQRIESFNTGRLDRRASAGGRLPQSTSSGRTTPLSYNLRRTNQPLSPDQPQLVAHYYPPESAASTSSEPSGTSKSMTASNSLQLSREGSEYARPMPTASLAERQYVDAQRTTPQEEPTKFTANSQLPRIGATSGTAMTIPETDILDSSCSDEEDAAVAGCANDFGNTSLNHDDAQVPSSSEDESEDPEYLELREREQIVERYEMGPDSKDVDPWENPDFELYKITDRYGFVHKKGPPKSQEEVERDRIDRELKREKKWLQMLEEWKQRHPSKLPERIWKGVPEKLRLVVWQRLLNVVELKKSSRENLYRELLMRARLISKDIKQIDLDINRTYRDHLAFRRRYDVKQQSLFNVLSAYALFNTEVGYCQGMSQIAAIFLMYMDEEDAFWCLHSLMVGRKYTMHGFFVPGFPKLQRYQEHFERTLQKYVPRVKKHLDKADIPPIYVTKWWFGCFLDRVPFSLALRLWDVFLYYGDCILSVMAYNIMKMHQKTIRKLNMETFMEFIQTTIANDFGFPDDKVMESLQDCLKKLQNDKMAIPPPPSADAPAEVPTKPMGEVLTRSMIDIRMSIAELHSRCSRANSLAGRSPAIIRRQNGRNPPSPMPLQSPNGTSKVAVTYVSGAGKETSGMRPHAAGEASVGAGAVGKPANVVVPTGNDTRNTAAPPLDPFRRKPSEKNRALPSPLPDPDGFLPMSPQRQHRKSYYDNVPSSASSVSGNGGMSRSVYNASFHSRETSSDRVQHLPNNVTYVAVGEPETVPYVPPPDYDDIPEDVAVNAARRLQHGFYENGSSSSFRGQNSSVAERNVGRVTKTAL